MSEQCRLGRRSGSVYRCAGFRVFRLLWQHFAEFLPDYENLDALKDHYRRGGLGDVKVKKFLNNVLQAELAPIREKRKYWEARPADVLDILKAGTAVAEEAAASTLHDVRRAMQIDYFESLLK